MRALMFAVALFVPQLVSGEVASTGPGKKQPPDPVCQQKEATWQNAEVAVWRKACTGPYTEGSMDPSSGKAEIRGQFVEDLLTKKVYRDRLELVGFGISHVKVKGLLNLAGLTLPTSLAFDDIDFDNEVHLDGSKISGLAISSGHASLISLSGARVDGNVSIEGNVEALSALDVAVQGNLDITGAREMLLTNARVEGRLTLNRLPFSSQVDASYAKVGGVVDIRESGARRRGARAEQGGLTADLSNTEIGQDLKLQDSDFDALLLSEARIKGSLRLVGSSFRTIVAPGIQISQDFAIESSQESVTRWFEPSRLDLTNARMSRLSTPRDLTVWPHEFSIQDVRFDSVLTRPGKTMGNGEKTAPVSDVTEEDWLVAWLGQATHSKYLSQPYQQIITTSTNSGQDGIREAVGFEKRQRERRVACTDQGIQSALSLDCLTLTFSWLLIGYGYRFYQTVGFVILFVALGAAAFQFVKPEDRKGLRYGFAYSFDMFLPLIRLRELHYDVDISNGVRYYFYAHKLAGWVVGSFLVAALAGFTK